MIRIERTDEFKANFQERANTKTQRLFRKLLKVFMKNPHDKSLHHIHPLKYDKQDCWSWSLTDDSGSDDFRIIYKKTKKNGAYIFIDFGTHSQLYRPWIKLKER